jgi:hypothetical protein
MSTTAAAASLIPDALPAVTVPSLAKTVRNFCSVSTFVSPRTCSSVAKDVVPLRVVMSTGTICSLK